MLTELRTDVAAKLTAAGIKTLEYVGEAMSTPAAVVVPSEPYIEWGRPDVPFGSVVVSVQVLLLAAREASKKAAATADEQIEAALAALNDYDARRVSQPGVVTLKSGAKFVGSVITIEITTEEP